MEKNRNEPFPREGATTGSSTRSEGTMGESRYGDRPEDMRDRPTRSYEGGSSVFGGAYSRTSQAVQSGYNRTLEYGREHPERLGVMTFAAGIGVGMLIAAAVFPRRTRTERVAGPLIDAAADLARTFARRR
jgi:hypothetical protein